MGSTRRQFRLLSLVWALRVARRSDLRPGIAMSLPGRMLVFGGYVSTSRRIQAHGSAWSQARNQLRSAIVAIPIPRERPMGNDNKVWEFNLCFKTDSSDHGPSAGKPVIVGAGMQGDRVFATPGEISRFITERCPDGKVNPPRDRPRRRRLKGNAAFHRRKLRCRLVSNDGSAIAIRARKDVPFGGLRSCRT